AQGRHGDLPATGRQAGLSLHGREDLGGFRLSRAPGQGAGRLGSGLGDLGQPQLPDRPQERGRGARRERVARLNRTRDQRFFWAFLSALIVVSTLSSLSSILSSLARIWNRRSGTTREYSTFSRDALAVA